MVGENEYVVHQHYYTCGSPVVGMSFFHNCFYSILIHLIKKRLSVDQVHHKARVHSVSHTLLLFFTAPRSAFRSFKIPFKEQWQPKRVLSSHTRDSNPKVCPSYVGTWTLDWLVESTASLQLSWTGLQQTVQQQHSWPGQPWMWWEGRTDQKQSGVQHPLCRGSLPRHPLFKEKPSGTQIFSMCFLKAFPENRRYQREVKLNGTPNQQRGGC